MVVQWEYNGYSNDDLVGGETPFFFNHRNRMMIQSDDFLRGIEGKAKHLEIGKIAHVKTPHVKIAPDSEVFPQNSDNCNS
jgi:hypothetical protein